MEGQRSERAKHFAEVHAMERVKAGVSQEYMAMELGVSKKTVHNWETGVSSPTFFQSLEWFRILNVNPFPHYLSIVYPKSISRLNAKASDENIDEAFDALQKTLPSSAKRALLYLFYGEHGSSPNAILQLILAHLHTSMHSRTVQAYLIAEAYEIAKESGTTVCNQNIQPDMDVLNKAIASARKAVVEKKESYSITNE